MDNQHGIQDHGISEHGNNFINDYKEVGNDSQINGQTGQEGVLLDMNDSTFNNTEHSMTMEQSMSDQTSTHQDTNL